MENWLYIQKLDFETRSCVAQASLELCVARAYLEPDLLASLPELGL